MTGKNLNKIPLKTLITGFSSLLMLLFVNTVLAETVQSDIQADKQGDKSVYEKMQPNGMKVIVKPDHRAPVVVSQVWYRVGSSYESGGTTGVSHVLEHMMFKGTEKFPAGEFNKIIARNGGDDNAFTSKDYTAY